jgi:hypothetical protein
MNNTVAAPSPFNLCSNLSKIEAYGLVYIFSVASAKMSKESLELLFSNLATVTAMTLTISNNPRVISAVSVGGVGSTYQSTLLTIPNTSQLSIGMSVTGVLTTLSMSAAVGPVLFTLVGHGLMNDDFLGSTL